MKFSIKYKILLIVFSILTLSLTVFFYGVFTSFEKDANNKLYHQSLMEIQSVKREIGFFFKYLYNTEKFPGLKIDNSFKTTELIVNSKSRVIPIRELLDSISNSHNVYFINTNNGIYPKNNFINQHYKKIKKKIFKNNMLSDVTEMMTSNKQKVLISYVKISPRFSAIKINSKDRIFKDINFAKIQSIWFYITVLSASFIFVLLFTHRLISPLLKLTETVKEVFQKEAHVKSLIKTNDEIGVLSDIFNQMGEKIFSLMDEANFYNTQLEDIVEQQTKAIKKTLKYQKALVNVLSQGFMIISNKMTVTDIYSTASINILGEDPKGKFIYDLVYFHNEKKANIKWINLLFEEKIPLPSLLKLAKEEIPTKSGTIVNYDIEPLRDKNNSIIAFVLVLTDMTNKIEERKNNLKLKQRSKMFVSLAIDRANLISALGLVNKLFAIIEQGQIEQYEIFRYVHSIKGAFLGLSIIEISDFLHQFEKDLKNDLPEDKLIDLSTTLKNTLSKKLDLFFKENGEISRIRSWKNPENYKNINSNHIKEFFKEISDKNIQRDILVRNYQENFMKTPISQAFSSFEKEVFNLANTLGKKIAPFNIKNDILICDSFMNEYFFIFEHILKNIIDHGIEMPEERISLNKEEQGTIHITVQEKENYYNFLIQDDGRGIETEKLVQKIENLNLPVDCNDEEKVINSIFLSGLSTKTDVSNISGRGVGMDAVKNIIEERGGRVSIESVINKGVLYKLEIAKVDLVIQSSHNIKKAS